MTVDNTFDTDLEEIAEVRPPAGSVEGGPAEVAYLLGHETNASIKAMNRLMSDGIDFYGRPSPSSSEARDTPPVR